MVIKIINLNTFTMNTTKKGIFSQHSETIRCFLLSTLVNLWVIYTEEDDEFEYNNRIQ